MGIKAIADEPEKKKLELAWLGKLANLLWDLQRRFRESLDHNSAFNPANFLDTLQRFINGTGDEYTKKLLKGLVPTGIISQDELDLLLACLDNPCSLIRAKHRVVACFWLDSVSDVGGSLLFKGQLYDHLPSPPVLFAPANTGDRQVRFMRPEVGAIDLPMNDPLYPSMTRIAQAYKGTSDPALVVLLDDGRIFTREREKIPFWSNYE